MNYPHLHIVPASCLKTVQTEEPLQKLFYIIQEVTRKFQEIITNVLSAGIPSHGGSLLNLEKTLHKEVARQCIDPVIMGFIAQAHESQEVQSRAQEITENTPYLRLQNSQETVNITLLGGSKLTLRTPYYLARPPKGRGRPRRKGKRGKAGNGRYPVLETLGIFFRVTPALASDVGRLVLLEPIETAVNSLKYRGIHLGEKVITCVALQLSYRGIDYREKLKSAIREGYVGNEAYGKRLVICTDGGRIRMRVPKRRGRLRKSGTRGFNAPWREPKVITIYEIDAGGRKKKLGLLRYDATMNDADETFSLMSTLLLSIGAQNAEEWIFISDGACWIWDRVPALIEAVGFDKEKVTQIIDFYHAVEHLCEISNEAGGMSKRKRRRWFNRVKTLLKNGKIDELLKECEPLCRGRNAKKIRKLLPYFEKNKSRMDYATFKKQAKPIGSGAVESCVRRVVNLRFKGNGIFWKEKTAEGLLHMRAQLLSGQWDNYILTLLRPKDHWFVSRQKPSAQILGVAA
ncbi:MAG: hypothetical protein AB2L14_22780 [Candidatus Xenobiia bacterium LiM19]